MCVASLRSYKVAHYTGKGGKQKAVCHKTKGSKRLHDCLLPSSLVVFRA